MTDPQQRIAAYLDDALSNAERDELAAWLKAHPDHLRAFVEANLFDQQIRNAVVGQVQCESANEFVPAEASPGLARVTRAQSTCRRNLCHLPPAERIA